VLALSVLLVLGLQLTQQLSAHLVLMVKPPLKAPKLHQNVLIVTKRLLDVSPALPLLLINAQSVMPDTP